MGEFEAEAEAIDEAGLLMQATEAADSVDDLIFFLGGLALIKVLLDLMGVLVAVRQGARFDKF